MIIKELFEQINFDEMMELLFMEERENHLSPKEKQEMYDSYLEAYQYFLKIEPVLNHKKVIMLFPCVDTGYFYYDVSLVDFTEGTPEIFGVDFMPWKEVLGCQVSEYNLKQYNLNLLAAQFIWEFTFYGYEPNEVDEEREELLEKTESIKALLKAGDDSHMKPFVFEDDRTEEEKTLHSNQMLFDMELNRHIVEEMITEETLLRKDN